MGQWKGELFTPIIQLPRLLDSLRFELQFAAFPDDRTKLAVAKEATSGEQFTSFNVTARSIIVANRLTKPAFFHLSNNNNNNKKGTAAWIIWTTVYRGYSQTQNTDTSLANSSTER